MTPVISNPQKKLTNQKSTRPSLSVPHQPDPHVQPQPRTTWGPSVCHLHSRHLPTQTLMTTLKRTQLLQLRKTWVFKIEPRHMMIMMRHLSTQFLRLTVRKRVVLEMRMTSLRNRSDNCYLQRVIWKRINWKRIEVTNRCCIWMTWVRHHFRSWRRTNRAVC